MNRFCRVKPKDLLIESTHLELGDEGSVKVTHIPTGFSVTASFFGSHHMNKTSAIHSLEEQLVDRGTPDLSPEDEIIKKLCELEAFKYGFSIVSNNLNKFWLRDKGTGMSHETPAENFKELLLFIEGYSLGKYV